jgi:hypothetical protein
MAWEAEGHSVELLHAPDARPRAVLHLAGRCDLLMWVDGGRHHDLDTLNACRGSTLVVGWSPDLFYGLERDGRWQDAPLWRCDMVLTADGDPHPWAAELGADHRWLLPGIRDGHTTSPSRVRNGWACDVAFVGNDGTGYPKEWPYRAELVARLREMCRRNGWTFRNPGGAERRIERGQHMTDFYRSARVTVGDSLCLRREQSRYWSDRVYEATGRGGVLVMPQVDALADDYGDLVPMYPWGDWDALEGLVAGLLQDGRWRDRLRTGARQHTSAKHTYRHRVGQMMGELGL